jgi:hypothetical protein
MFLLIRLGGILHSFEVDAPYELRSVKHLVLWGVFDSHNLSHLGRGSDVEMYSEIVSFYFIALLYFVIILTLSDLPEFLAGL